MQENNKRIAKNTLMLYFRMMLIMGVTLYTSRVVLEVLGVEDFGIYNVVGGIVVMFGFLNSAMSSATQRFLSFEMGRKDYAQLKKVFSLSVTIHALIAVVIFILAETIGLWFLNTQLTIPADRMEASNWVYQFSIFAFMVNVMAVPYNAAIISHERMNVYAYVSIIEVILKLAIVFLLQYFGFDKLKLYAILVFVVSFIVRMVYRIYCKRKFEECTYRFVWDKKLFKELTSFSGWSLFGSLAYMAKSQGVNMILNLFYGVTVNAAWGISHQINGALVQFTSNFTLALNPPIVKAYASKEKSQTLHLLFKGMKFAFFLSFVLTVPFIFEANLVLDIWLKNVPEYSVVFTQLILINSLLESLAHTIGMTVQATGKIKAYQALIGGVLLLNIPIIYLLSIFFKFPPLAIFASVLLTCIAFIFRFIILKNLINFSYQTLFYEVFRPIIILIIITIPLLFFIHTTVINDIVRFLLIIFCTIIPSATVLYRFGMEKNERVFVRNQIKNIYNKIKTI